MAQQNALTVEKQAGDFLRSLKDTLPAYAVREYRQEAFVKSAMIAISSNEDLQECLKSDEGKASLINAMRMAAGTGLDLNPQSGKAALVPYSKKVNNKWIKTANYQIMKGGLIDLAMDSGKVEHITADTVRANDEFTISKSTNGDEYRFAPARKNRGEIDGFFASVKMKDGTCHCKYMDIDEVLEHKEKYAKNLTDQNGKEKESHAWNKSLVGMAEKTVLKRLLRNLHISDDLAQATGADNYEHTERDVTPPEKGTSADELQEKLQERAAKPEPEPEAVEAEVVEKDEAPKQGSII